MGPAHSQKTRWWGDLSIFASAFFFYLSTAVVRWGAGRVEIDAAYYVFARFLFGIVTVMAVMAVGRTGLRVRSYHLLIGRAVFNTIAVYCFYKAVALTTVAEGNILNMTFPLFVAVFSWLFLKKQREAMASLMVVVAFVGVWIVLAPDLTHFKSGSLWGLASGVTAAAAILYLNLSRRDHDTNTILFFMFGIGAIAIYAVYHRHIFWPNPTEIFYLTLCAGLGVIGQYLLTIGFRYVSAVEGSIVSCARILMAALLGPYMVGDPALTPAGWIGAFLILGANVYLAVRRVGG
ncbi:MAG: EamA family transporter [Desulfobacterales bacterium]|nr:EamA family transporter [Desulfobacterales bacterium]